MRPAELPEPLISVVIVSYNTRQMTLDCLQALLRYLDDIPTEVFVVDNASKDGSAEAVRETLPQVKVIANSENVGFGPANNQAMAVAEGKYLLLLNSDAFVKPTAIRTLLDYLGKHEEVAVVGPRLLNGDGSLQLSCYRFPSPLQAWCEELWVSYLFPSHPLLGNLRRWQHDRERYVDWVIGACMLVRRQVYEQVGGFDPTFFMYQEETDWQQRMAEAGWRIAFTPAAQVTHLGGSSGNTEQVRIRREFFESLDSYMYKHYRLSGLISVRFAMAVGSLLRLFAWLAVWLVLPKRRAAAASKIALRAWLIIRQLTSWRLPRSTKTVS